MWAKIRQAILECADYWQGVQDFYTAFDYEAYFADVYAAG